MHAHIGLDVARRSRLGAQALLPRGRHCAKQVGGIHVRPRLELLNPPLNLLGAVAGKEGVRGRRGGGLALLCCRAHLGVARRLRDDAPVARLRRQAAAAHKVDQRPEVAGWQLQGGTAARPDVPPGVVGACRRSGAPGEVSPASASQAGVAIWAAASQTSPAVIAIASQLARSDPTPTQTGGHPPTRPPTHRHARRAHCRRC